MKDSLKKLKKIKHLQKIILHVKDVGFIIFVVF